MGQEEEKDFQVTDKRHTQAAEEEEAPKEPETPEEEPLPPIEVPALIMLFINQLAAISWQRMGLMPDSLSGKIEKNLDEARLAIDSVAALAGTLSPALPASEQRDLQTLISNLRLNFVRQQGHG